MGKVFEVWFTYSGAFLVLLLLPSVMGWGKEGHFAICKIAQGLLNKDTLTAVKALLPDYADGDLAAVCSWADEVRFHMRWSSPLHYVDTPDFRCNYKYCRDCHDTVGRKDRCVTGAIYNYTEQLLLGVHEMNSDMNNNLTEALMFLSHFIGDVHQPLHVGFLGDEGGNTITVRWYRRKTNLHHNEILAAKKFLSLAVFPDLGIGGTADVWDTMMIDSSLKTFYNSDLSSLIQAIQSNITGVWFTDSLSWRNCTADHVVCPDPYASESIELACKFAYKNATPGTTLGDEYFLSRLPVVEKRLAQAGVRLAATLNRIFTSTPTSVTRLNVHNGGHRTSYNTEIM